MYNIIKAAIEERNYKLEEMIERIQAYGARGRITLDEQAELEKLAREKATVRGEIDLYAKVVELEKRIRALEENENSEQAEEYPAYVPGKLYKTGDKCSENGVNYVCIAPEGAVCVWSPSNYPAYWEEA